MRSTEGWITLYEDENVLLRLEVHNGLPFLHCEVEGVWNKREYLRQFEIWVEVQETLRQQGIDYLFAWAPDGQVARFATMFGFKLIMTDEVDQSLLFLKY